MTAHHDVTTETSPTCAGMPSVLLFRVRRGRMLVPGCRALWFAPRRSHLPGRALGGRPELRAYRGGKPDATLCPPTVARARRPRPPRRGHGGWGSRGAAAARQSPGRSQSPTNSSHLREGSDSRVSCVVPLPPRWTSTGDARRGFTIDPVGIVQSIRLGVLFPCDRHSPSALSWSCSLWQVRRLPRRVERKGRASSDDDANYSCESSPAPDCSPRKIRSLGSLLAASWHAADLY